MKRFTIVLALIAVFISISFAFTKPEKPRYKNLKILPKNTTKDQMDSVMKHFTASLGVKCNFCHIRLEDEQKNWDFASDKNKHKNIAREMMQMTNKVNKKFFEIKNPGALETKLEVTCFTCHQGHKEPSSWPPPPPPAEKKPQ